MKFYYIVLLGTYFYNLSIQKHYKPEIILLCQSKANNYQKEQLIGKWELYALKKPWMEKESLVTKESTIEFTISKFRIIEKNKTQFECNYNIIKDEQFFYGDNRLIVCDSKPIYSFKIKSNIIEIYELSDDRTIFLYKKCK